MKTTHRDRRRTRDRAGAHGGAAAGADEPRVGPRRLHDAQEHREAAGRAEGADRRARRADRRGQRGSGRTASSDGSYAKGMTLLAGRPWTDAADFGASLVLRTEHVVADSSKPYAVRLEQIYTPSIELRARRRRRTSCCASAPVPARRRARRRSRARSSRISATFDGVSRDLRESPFPFELDVHDVADGAYRDHRRRHGRRRRRSARASLAHRAAQGPRRARSRVSKRRRSTAPADAARRACSSRSTACAT